MARKTVRKAVEPAPRPGHLEALIDGVSLDDWIEIVNRNLQKAKEGDKDARSWLSEYLMGKPGAIRGSAGETTKAPPLAGTIVITWGDDDE